MAAEGMRAGSVDSKQQLILDNAANWAKEHKINLQKALPFNPFVARSAFESIEKIDTGFNSWQEIVQMFTADASLVSQFMRHANVEIKERKKDYTVDDVIHACKVLGADRTRIVLECALSDELLDKLKNSNVRGMKTCWRECWGMASATEQLSMLSQNSANPLKREKARYIGMMCDIGVLMFINVFGSGYFSRTGYFDLPGILNGEMLRGDHRLSLERRNLGIDHAELGFWMLYEIGLDRSYCLAALEHESYLENNNHEDYTRLSVYANKIVQSVLHAEMIDLVNDDISDEDETNFHQLTLNHRNGITRKIVDDYAIGRGRAKEIFKAVESDINKQSRVFFGESSGEKLEDLGSVIEYLRQERTQKLDRLISMIADISHDLPWPLAIDFRGLYNSEGLSDKAMYINHALQHFTRLMSSVALSSFLNTVKIINPQNFEILLRDWFVKKKVNKIYTSMGGGICVTKDLLYLESKLRQNAGKPAGAFEGLREFLEENTKQLYAITEKRAKTKNQESINADLLPNLVDLLTKFSRLGYEFILPGTLEYDDADENYKWKHKSWMGTDDIRTRSWTENTISKPMLTAANGMVIKHRESKKISQLSAFLTTRACPDCGEEHFYLANSIICNPDSKRGGIQIEMAPLYSSHRHDCKAYYWHSSEYLEKISRKKKQ